MRQINYQQLINAKLSKNTNEPSGTAYINVNGEYQEQQDYGYYEIGWDTIAKNETTIDIPLPIVN